MIASNKVVLIVDDDTYFRESLSDILREWNYNVLTTGGCKETLKILKEKRIDIVMMDIIMGEIDGIECLKQIRERHPGIRVIMMTAYHSERARASALGAIKVLSKPLVLEQVKLLLEET